MLMKITCLIQETLSPSLLSSFYSILFCSIIFYSFFILFYFYDQGMLVTMVTSTPVLFLSRGQSSTHSVEDQNKLEVYDLNFATHSIKRSTCVRTLDGLLITRTCLRPVTSTLVLLLSRGRSFLLHFTTAAG
jgi:hypothetical protein